MTRYLLGLLSGLLIAGATGVCYLDNGDVYTLEPVTVSVTPTRMSLPTSTPAPALTPTLTPQSDCVQMQIPAGVFVAIRAAPSDTAPLVRYARNETLQVQAGTGWVAVCGGRGYVKR